MPRGYPLSASSCSPAAWFRGWRGARSGVSPVGCFGSSCRSRGGEGDDGIEDNIEDGKVEERYDRDGDGEIDNEIVADIEMEKTMTFLAGHQDPRGDAREARRVGGDVGGMPPGMMPLVGAPGRKIKRIVTKAFPNGRRLNWVYSVKTELTQTAVWQTFELEHAPTLDCGCTAECPDDVAFCVLTQTCVCVRRHALTCQKCGLVVASFSAAGVVLPNGIQAICCRPCAEELTASTVAKVFKRIKNTLWGE